MGSKYLRLISDRPSMQDRAYMEQFVSDIRVTTFEDLKTFKKEQEIKYKAIVSEHSGMRERMGYLESLLRVYEKYEPYIKFHKEQWELKGWERKKYERKHMVELAYYATYSKGLKDMITEPDKKITAGAWKKELASLQAAYEKSTTPYAEVVTDLACVEVLQHNRRDLDRMLENESHKRTAHKGRDANYETTLDIYTEITKTKKEEAMREFYMKMVDKTKRENLDDEAGRKEET